ncbi:MAG: hypothetical protein Q7U02_11980 [Desulfosalsimonadaceae bacterium]|nr:hypothetical protein [Desulfosalsimonadaceae bacterium]
MKTLIKIAAAMAIIFFAAFYFLTGGHFFQKSGLSNCVVVGHETDFTGEWLKHSRHVSFDRTPTPECIEKDRKIDKGDGPKAGKVRWAECTFGPDCDEAGMF